MEAMRARESSETRNARLTDQRERSNRNRSRIPIASQNLARSRSRRSSSTRNQRRSSVHGSDSESSSDCEDFDTMEVDNTEERGNHSNVFYSDSEIEQMKDSHSLEPISKEQKQAIRVQLKSICTADFFAGFICAVCNRKYMGPAFKVIKLQDLSASLKEVTRICLI